MKVQMSFDEKVRLAMQSVELEKAGKTNEAKELMRQIPLAPYLAKAIKETFGTEALVSGGYNLSEAETEYGQNWLDR